MLGCTFQNNNVYVFFEGDELNRLGEMEIDGRYFNLDHPEIFTTLNVGVSYDFGL